MKKILPIVRPKIFSYSHQCAVHAILMSYDECNDWIFNNYIQIYCLKNLYNTHRKGTLDFFYHFYGDFNFYEQYSNPWLLMNRISRQNVLSKWNNEINYINECIFNEEYVFAVINKQYVLKQDRAFYHPVLVYGIDEENEILYCADNDSLGKYNLMEITFNDYLKGCDIPVIEDYYDKRPEGICSFKVRKKKDDIDSYKFYIDKVIIDFNSYINPVASNEFAHVYGVDCYDELCKYYALVMNNLEYCDLRAISSLLDHKILMIERFKYMKKHNYLLNNVDNLIDGSEQIMNLVNSSQKLIIKYNITKDKNIIEHVINVLKNTCVQEINLLKNISL